MVHLPKLSIAAKLYAIFALLATATVLLAAVSVYTSRLHSDLTDDFGVIFTFDNGQPILGNV